MRRQFTLLALVALIALGACGRRGTIYLPQPPEAPATTLKSPAPQSPSPSVIRPSDTNTVKETVQ